MIIKFQDGFQVPVISFDKLVVDGIKGFVLNVDPSYEFYENYTNGCFFLFPDDEDFWLLTKESMELLYGKDN